MKNYYAVLFLSFLFNIILSAQSGLSSEQINFYQSKAQSSSFFSVTEDMVKQIYESVASERESILTLLDQMYPGLKEQMDKDLQTIANIKDSAKMEELIVTFEKDYLGKVSEVWSASGIKDVNLQKKYTNILGNIPFKVSQFGGILISENHISENQVADIEESTTHPDNFTQNGVLNKRWQSNGGCDDIFYGRRSIEQLIRGYYGDYPRMLLQAGIGEACEINFLKGCDITIPDKEYKFLIANFRQPLSELGSRAFSVLGVSWSESTVSIHIASEGVDIVKRDIAQTITVAPILWLSVLWTDIPANATIALYDADKLAGKKYTVYRRMHGKVVGAGGGSAMAYSYVMGEGVQMTLIK